MPHPWQWHEDDQAVFAAELADYVPSRVFDAHAHLHQVNWWAEPPDLVTHGPAVVGAQAYRELMGWIVPGREVTGLLFAYPFREQQPEQLAAANEWVASEAAASPPCRGLWLARPDDDPDWVCEQVRAHGFRGFKVYNIYAPVAEQWDAEVPDYLPERLMEVANREGWTVVLHLVRARGIADASNQHWVRRYCEAYPEAQIILAHCARGFSPYHVREGLPRLAGLGNLWVDTSAVCNSLSVLTCLEVLGPDRVLFGSDFCVSHLRGTNLGVADTFLWVDEDSGLPAPAYVHGFHWPLTGIENLRAVKAAFEVARLADAQIEAYFWGNAAQLWGA